MCRINSNTEIVITHFLKEFDKIILPEQVLFIIALILLKDNWFEEIQEMVINKKTHTVFVWECNFFQKLVLRETTIF